MLFLLLFVVVALALGGVFVTARDDVLGDAPPDDADIELPPGRIVPEDLRALRFGMVFRGYRMSEVDAVLDRLTGQLAERDERIADLERMPAEVIAPVVAEPQQAPAADDRATPPGTPEPEREGAQEPDEVALPVSGTAPAPVPLPDAFGLEAVRTSVPEPTTAAFEWPVHAEPAEAAEPVEPVAPHVDPWPWTVEPESEPEAEAEEPPSGVQGEAAATSWHAEDGLDFPEIPAAEVADSDATEAEEPSEERERPEG